MPGALDAAFRQAAEAIVKDLGAGLDVEIDYVREVSGDYNVSTGTYTKLNQTYFGLSVPVEFIDSEEETESEKRKARVYIAPSQIGDHQPTLTDEITLKYADASRKTQITDIRTYRGGQQYLFIVEVVF